jgi:hypothetical protein
MGNKMLLGVRQLRPVLAVLAKRDFLGCPERCDRFLIHIVEVLLGRFDGEQCEGHGCVV